MRASVTLATPPAALNSGPSMDRRNSKSSWLTWGEWTGFILPALYGHKNTVNGENNILDFLLKQ